MISDDVLLLIISLLLPLTALFTVREGHFPRAVLARGLFGVAAALVYALMGAPDVALVEILMSALLVTLLYIVVFNRSREVRVGLVEEAILEGEAGRFLGDFFRREGLRFRGILFASRDDLGEALDESLVDAALVEGDFARCRHFPAGAPSDRPRLVVPEETEDLILLIEAHMTHMTHMTHGEGERS